ncbi:hypothetical protein RFI_09792, partial [Reticulomyxa filosa]
MVMQVIPVLSRQSGSNDVETDEKNEKDNVLVMEGWWEFSNYLATNSSTKSEKGTVWKKCWVEWNLLTNVVRCFVNPQKIVIWDEIEFPTKTDLNQEVLTFNEYNYNTNAVYYGFEINNTYAFRTLLIHPRKTWVHFITK